MTGLETALVVGAAAALLALGAVAGALAARRGGGAAAQAQAARLEALAHAQERAERALREELATSRRELGEHTKHLRVEVAGSVQSAGESVEKRLEDLRGVVDLRLREIQAENAQRLDAMRATVDEKLQGTLERRLGEAFQQVSQRLEAVHQGLGEMQTLAAGVGDLKKVLTNVKTRGTWGEVQLEALLAQVLAPGQYEANVAPRPASGERVEFAIRLPGPDGEGGDPVWLPIDAKFPQEDYARLVDAQERAVREEADAAARALEARVAQEARRIRDKYVCPPHTTDFAILFLPTEGLYAEVLRRPGLVERLQRECRVTVAGPTTLAAVLNSLQMGFRTLAIQKRSGEVWKLLGAVRTQFGQFSELLDKVGRKLEEASTTVGAATRKSRTIERRLGRVEQLAPGEAEALLPESE